MFVFKAAVVGAGTMGGQIAQTIAAAGIPVLLKDVNSERVEAGLAEARRVTTRAATKLVEKGKLDATAAQAQVEATTGLIEGTTSYDGFGDVDFVIEAVSEDLAIKQVVFEELDAATPGHAILASNTSSLSITELADVTLRTDKVVGFHFFFPASHMPLVEVVEGVDTSTETMAAAVAFAMSIRKQPIRCADAPGFIVNRIMVAATSEIWHHQESGGLAIAEIDQGLVERKLLPIGPYALNDLLGLDVALHVAQEMQAAWGERFLVPRDMAALVKAGHLGNKTGGGYFDGEGKPAVAGDRSPDLDTLGELLVLKTFVEAAYVMQDGIATHRDIDLAMISGAGHDLRKGLMPPFMRADADGLDDVLARLERASADHGDRFEPPLILRRLVAQGRLGMKSGQGFYAYPRFDEDQPGETVKLQTRGDIAIAWLVNGPLNSISAQVARDLEAVFDRAEQGGMRALILASASPFAFCAGADLKDLRRAGDAEITERMNALTQRMERSGVVTIAAVNGIALGGGSELALACDVRLAARSAIFGQPEIKLGVIPGFGGTQRLPRLVGDSRALELNLFGDPVGAEDAFEIGLVSRVVDDHELFDVALAWARRAAEQAPLAVAAIKRVSGNPDLAAGLREEQQAFASVFGSEDGEEGIAAFLAKRRPKWAPR
ncbi:MAG TPA: enoyl-CoA hydratase-related protein [Baekduia sp.]|nr:enoyl-CoA hydratase-related protein [Baekduia sp.]